MCDVKQLTLPHGTVAVPLRQRCSSESSQVLITSQHLTTKASRTAMTADDAAGFNVRLINSRVAQEEATA